MLDKQIEVKRNREIKRKMEELQQEKYIVDGFEPQYSFVQNGKLDYLPHEWNDPGMRYLRKSMSSVDNSEISQGNTPNSGVLNRTLDQGMSVYSSGK